MTLAERLEKVLAFKPKFTKDERDKLYAQSAVYDKESFFEGAVLEYARTEAVVKAMRELTNSILNQRQRWVDECVGFPLTDRVLFDLTALEDAVKQMEEGKK